MAVCNFIGLRPPKIFAALLLCGTVLSVFYAQSQSLSDSVLVKESHTAFEELIHINHDSAILHLENLNQLSSDIDYVRGKFLYLYDMGYYLFTQRKMDSSLYQYQKSLDMAEKHRLEKEVVMAKIWIGNHMYFKNEREAARKTYEEVITESITLNYIDGIANGYYGLASLENDAEKILLLHLKIDSLYKAHGTYSPILSNSLGALGKIYLDLGFIESAKEYYAKSFEIAKKSNYVSGLDYANEIRGEIELRQNNLTKAEEYFKKALKKSKQKKDTFLIAQNLTNLASVDFRRADYEMAIDKLKTAHEYLKLVKDSVSLTYANLQLAKNYIELGKLAEAKGHLAYAAKYPKYLSENDYRISFLETSIRFNEAQESFSKAFELQKKLQELKIEIEKNRNSVAFVEFERRNALEKNQQKIALLNSEKELIEQQKTNQRNLLLGGMGLTSLIGIFLFFQYRNRQKTNKKLRELDQLKSNFFANISHEFRTPLTLISTPVEQKLASGKLSKTDRKDFEMIQRNSQRLLSLVDQLLDLSKLEAGKYQLRVAKSNLGNLIDALGESFQFTAKQQDIAYKIDVEGLQEAWFDKDVIEKIMANLLSNAMKYTDKGGKVLLKAKRENDKAVILVENSASSINPETLEKLFDRFYQANAHAEGVGIGLSLVKELVGVNHGSIKADQTSEGTLQFEIVLPIAKSAFKKDEFAEQSFNEAYVVPSNLTTFSIPIEALEDINEEDDRDILLLVEDNAEVRQLLRNTFTDAYQIVEAADGQEGIEKALEHVPDLIISDIMMPKVDGLKLCETLKTDERTSHIPIILLTAKAGEEDQYKGLSTGADAYVTKPFKTRMLETRVKNLITSRKALRNRYSQEVILKPKDIAITNLDELFLERVQNVLEQKLTESSFSIQEFSKAVGMSRMQLHRKLKALTGLSASEFVRSQRLKLAAELLKKSNVNVSQIGYQVGFNDPSYFTKCFREAYGASPTEYSVKNR